MQTVTLVQLNTPLWTVISAFIGNIVIVEIFCKFFKYSNFKYEDQNIGKQKHNVIKRNYNRQT